MRRISVSPLALLAVGLAFVAASGRAWAQDAAPAAPSAGPVVAQVFGDWIYRCQKITLAGKPDATVCEVAQQMVVHQGDKTVPVMTLAFLRGNGSAGHAHLFNVLAPLGVLLKQNLLISTDTGKPVTADYLYCDATGCWSRDQPADAVLAEMRHGKVGHAKVVMLNGRGVTIDFSTNGLDPAMSALDGGKPPEPAVAQAAPAAAAPPPVAPAQTAPATTPPAAAAKPAQ